MHGTQLQKTLSIEWFYETCALGVWQHQITFLYFAGYVDSHYSVTSSNNSKCTQNSSLRVSEISRLLWLSALVCNQQILKRFSEFKLRYCCNSSSNTDRLLRGSTKLKAPIMGIRCLAVMVLDNQKCSLITISKNNLAMHKTIQCQGVWLNWKIKF